MWLNAFSPGFHPHPSPPSSPQTPYDTLGRDLRPKTYCLKNFTSMWGKISTVKRLETFSRKPLFLAGSLSWLDGQITLHVGHCASTAKGQKIFRPSATLTKEDATRKTLPHCQNQVKKWRESKRVPYRRGSKLSRIFFAKSPTLLSFQI